MHTALLWSTRNLWNPHRNLRSPLSAIRSLCTTLPLSATVLPPRPKLKDSDLHHVSLKGSGPGGQKINKTNSAIQITHIPTGTVVKSQATRSRSQNYSIARQILAEKIELMEKGDASRVAKKIALKSKRKASAAKKSNRKYRALDEEKKPPQAAMAADASDVSEDGGAKISQSDGSSEGRRGSAQPT